MRPVRNRRRPRQPVAHGRPRANRRGAATAEYVLAVGVVLPLLVFAIPAARRIMQLVYEFAATFAAWPFM